LEIEIVRILVSVAQPFVAVRVTVKLPVSLLAPEITPVALSKCKSLGKPTTVYVVVAVEVPTREEVRVYEIAWPELAVMESGLVMEREMGQVGPMVRMLMTTESVAV
jgi:hypothetical protein